MRSNHAVDAVDIETARVPGSISRAGLVDDGLVTGASARAAIQVLRRAFLAIGQFYDDFTQISDDEVTRMLSTLQPAQIRSPPPTTIPLGSAPWTSALSS